MLGYLTMKQMKCLVLVSEMASTSGELGYACFYVCGCGTKRESKLWGLPYIARFLVDSVSLIQMDNLEVLLLRAYI